MSSFFAYLRDVRYLTDPKLLAMWGTSAFRLRSPHAARGGCWEQHARGMNGTASTSTGRRFFEDALTGERCDRNWLQGSLGGEDGRPYGAGTGASPALLGMDEAINALCSSRLGLRPLHAHADWNAKLADRCVRARLNILRLSGPAGWSLCENVVWQLCALQGRLPGQGSSIVSFATAPSELQLRWWENASSYPTWPCEKKAGGGCDPQRYTLADVFMVEVMLTWVLCANRERLTTLGVGEPFECERDDGERFRGLVGIVTFS